MKCKVYESCHIDSRFEDMEKDINEFIKDKTVRFVTQSECHARSLDQGEHIHVCVIIWYD
ncbi:hypothetical protein HS125_12405 [bacterium]|nr:hypothetical protein [bacterium]